MRPEWIVGVLLPVLLLPSVLMATGCGSPSAGAQPEPAPNSLTSGERAAGWKPLFDGQTTRGWRGFKKHELPAGWQAVDGTLARVGQGGDIVTEGQFESFELALEWKLAPGGNSGIFYHVTEDADYVWQTGPEYQVLDNQMHPDGHAPLTSAGTCYALYAPEKDDTRPVGQWNETRIRVDHGHVEHRLNGVKQCDYVIGSPDWNARVKGSKFASMPLFGTKKKGHIALQDHGDPVAFRNIKIRELP